MKSLRTREIQESSKFLLWTWKVENTPIQEVTGIYNKDTGIDLYLKREDLQPVKSFKIRWALNAMSLLSDDQKNKGVVCASAWNHAQWFAIACKYFGIHGTVFMPEAAPNVKIEATKRFGEQYIDIQLIPGWFDEVKEASESFTQEKWATYIHPFDDTGVMIGAATIGYEVFSQMKSIGKQVDYLVAPVGGWGLIAWLISAKNLFSPQTIIIWAEPTGHSSMKKSLQKWRISNFANPHSSRFADGTAVARVGEKTFEICKNDNLHVIDVRKDRLSTYLEKLLLLDSSIELEPSWALSVAAIWQEIDTFRGKTVVSILSGANIDSIRKDAIGDLAQRHREYRKWQWKKPV
jgi:threonine dehydratase